jgi:hypothetical protein
VFAAPSAAPKDLFWSYDYEAPAPSKPAHASVPNAQVWSYGYETEVPTPATAAAHDSAPATPSDDGFPWMTLGFIVAGASLLISGAVFLTTRRRPPTAHAV